MVIIQVFDPPMCCATGVCGLQVDPALTQFAADVIWLRSQGVRVERFNLADEPSAFAESPVVKQMLVQIGVECLPLVLVDGDVVSQAAYPSREELAVFTGIAAQRAPGGTGTAEGRRSFQQDRQGGYCRGRGCCG